MRNAIWTMGVFVGLVVTCSTGAQAQDWPQWRGPNRDNKVSGFIAPKTWPKELTKKWQVTVGIGESSPLLVGDKIYVFARQDKDEVTLCLDAATGKELWKDKLATAAVSGPAKPHQGPRSTPAVAEGKICTLGVAGTVSCLDAATGKVLWRKDTAKPVFYTSSSPLIVEGKCIVYVDALTAYDLAGGNAKWQWKGAGTPYGSPVLSNALGMKQIVTPTVNGIADVSLADGKELWLVKIGGTPKEYQNNFSTPIVDGQTVIYTAAAKSGGKENFTGTMALKIDKKGDGLAATELWKNSLAAHQFHTPVLKDGLLFGVTTGLNFFCMDSKTGDKLWQDTTARGKCGCILDVGPVLLALSSDKELIAFKASKKAYEEVAKYKVADAETWSIPIIAGNRVYVKDKGGSLTLWTIE